MTTLYLTYAEDGGGPVRNYEVSCGQNIACVDRRTWVCDCAEGNVTTDGVLCDHVVALTVLRGMGGPHAPVGVSNKLKAFFAFVVYGRSARGNLLYYMDEDFNPLVNEEAREAIAQGAMDMTLLDDKSLFQELLEVVPEALREGGTDPEEVLNRGRADQWRSRDDSDDDSMGGGGDYMDIDESVDEDDGAEGQSDGATNQRAAVPLTNADEQRINSLIQDAIDTARRLSQTVERVLQDPNLDRAAAGDLAKQLKKVCEYIMPSEQDTRHSSLRDLGTRVESQLKRKRRKGETPQGLATVASVVAGASRRRVAPSQLTMHNTNRTMTLYSRGGQSSAPLIRGRPLKQFGSIEYM